jgi:tetratricopeptide (TPR) repeat protein
MDLERKNRAYSIIMKVLAGRRCIFVLLLLLSALPCPAQSQRSGKPELIRDTDIAEGKENQEAGEVLEPDPVLAEKSFNIGNFYYKNKNYTAAIQRYSDALAYRPNWEEAGKALDRAIRAYQDEIHDLEKDGNILEAVRKCRDFIKRYPDSPKLPDFRDKLFELEAKSE